MVDHRLSLAVGPRDGRGQHSVKARLGDVKFTDRLDLDVQFKRRACRRAILTRFDLPDESEEWIEERLLDGAAAADSQDGTPLYRPVVTMLDTVKPGKIQWLWPNRIARGKINLLCGDPGRGKSLLATDMAARVSRDSPFPNEFGTDDGPGQVLILSNEDDVHDTIAPRLIDHGADMSRIGIIEGLAETDGDGKVVRGVDLAADMKLIDMACETLPDCRLVVIDPISAYLGKVDSHKNSDVRGALLPLTQLAKDRGIAVVLISHFRKSDGRAIHAAMGSLAFVAAARTAWAISECQENPRRRLMTCLKSNLSQDSTGLAFTIESYGADDGPVICWEPEPIVITAEEALTPPKAARGRKPRERQSAADWLAEQLAGGPQNAGELLDQAEAEGFRRRTVQRAYGTIGAKPQKDGMGGGWIWAAVEDDSKALSPANRHLRHLQEKPEEDTNKKKTNIILPA